MYEFVRQIYVVSTNVVKFIILGIIFDRSCVVGIMFFFFFCLLFSFCLLMIILLFWRFIFDDRICMCEGLFLSKD